MTLLQHFRSLITVVSTAWANKVDIRRVDTLADLRGIPVDYIADGDQCTINCYSTPEDGGGGNFRWDASSADADDSGLTILPTGHTGNGRWKRFYDQSIKVTYFGADPTGVSDSGTAINLAFNALRAWISEATLSVGMYVEFPYGRYKTTIPINATGIRRHGWGILGNGSQIIGHSTGKCVLDMVQSRFGHIKDLCIWGDATNTPKFGIQVGRINTTDVSDCHHFDNVECEGYYSKASFYNYASESLTGKHCRLFNRHSNVGTSYCLIQDGTNDFGMASDYQTITTPAGTSASFNDNTWDNLDCRKLTSGRAIYMRRTAGHRYNTGFAVSYDDAAIEINSDTFGQENLYLDVHCETTGLVECVRFTDSNGGSATPSIRGFRFHDYHPMASSAVFNADDVTTVTIYNADISIPGYAVNPSNGIFHPKGNFKVYGGTIYTGSGVELTNLAEENSIRIIENRANPTFGAGSQLFFDETNNTIGLKGELTIYDGPLTATTGANLGTNSGKLELRGNQLKVITAAGVSAVLAGNSLTFTTTVIQKGTGSPESVVTAPQGSLFLRTDGGAGTTFYVKESGIGNTGWIAK